jgi:predicted MPP superfamily phosphohydrolase
MSRIAAALVLAVVATWRLAALPVLELPNRASTVKFAVLGDAGTGDKPQEDVAAQMGLARQLFAFDFVILLGDNFYGSQRPPDLIKKFDRPYKSLLDAQVTFHAAIGNHDEPDTVNYPPLNMAGQRYYTYARQHVRFFVLDTNVMTAAQLRWFETALREAAEPWKIAYFHHPLYGSAGRHGAAVDIRVLLEPLLVKYGVTVVFSGHDHVYERLRPQRGIHYFVAGSGGKLRKGDLTRTDETAAGFDQDQAFMIVEVDLDQLFFQTISRTGVTVDAGAIPRRVAHIGSM